MTALAATHERLEVVRAEPDLPSKWRAIWTAGTLALGALLDAGQRVVEYELVSLPPARLPPFHEI